MKKLLMIAAACAGVYAQQGGAPQAVKVTKIAGPEKALKLEVTVPGKLDDVWRAFTTREGLNTWLWKDCTVDLREGGGWTVHYPGGATGGGTIVRFEPKRQIVIHAMAPEKFPEVRRTGTTAVFDFEDAGGKTVVRLTQTGWKEGREWDDAFEYLAGGNAQLLGQLHYRFAKGPIDWERTAGK